VERSLTWITNREGQGWACSQCEWTYPIPTLLTDPGAKDAYDRLASANFAEHACSKHPRRANPSSQENVAERARKLVKRGFKPKDAVEITLQEIMFEHSGDPKIIEKAHLDAEDFLRRLKEGLI